MSRPATDVSAPCETGARHPHRLRRRHRAADAARDRRRRRESDHRGAGRRGARVALRSLGVEPGGTIPPALRAQLKTLEEDQKRRATRSLRDGIDRIMVDLLSLYRDILLLQLGADVEPINLAIIDQLRAAAAHSVRRNPGVRWMRSRRRATHRGQRVARARPRGDARDGHEGPPRESSTACSSIRTTLRGCEPRARLVPLSGCVDRCSCRREPDDDLDPDRREGCAELEPFYRQVLQWSKCEGAFQCATATAPLDWEDPARESISSRAHPGDGDRRPPRLAAGEPGRPGRFRLRLHRDSLDYAVTPTLERALRRRGLRPARGRQSSAVSCYDDPSEMDCVPLRHHARRPVGY